MDEIVFDFDMVHCQSRGNCGGCAAPLSPRHGGPEAWAKNVISVGGVKHYDTPETADDRWCTYGYPSCDSSCASIGPASDGRVKPDLVGFYECIYTVGCVLSCGPTDYNTGFHGTSAAAPQVCGHVGLLMEMWADDADGDGKNIFGIPVPPCNPAPENCVFKRRPHSATARAMLINTANQYNWIPSGPNHDITRFVQGWGRPHVKNLYDLRQKMVIVNETKVLTLFQKADYPVKVGSGEPALKATMVYTDFPGTTSSTVHRINNLSMKATSPTGLIYQGNNGLATYPGSNGQTGLWSASGAVQDDGINTVENVFVQNPTGGIWTVRVTAHQINKDGHVETPTDDNCAPASACDVDFGLVISGVTAAGACHLPGGSCILATSADCLAQSGAYDGDFTLCTPPDPCPPTCE